MPNAWAPSTLGRLSSISTASPGGGSWEGEGASRSRPDEEPPELKRTRDTYYVTIARLDKNREAIVRFKQYSARALFGSARWEAV
jgi:hypothetical protein